MGIYDSRRFSREFSERTRKNLEYITRAVEPDAQDIEFRKNTIKAYQDIIDYINNETRSLHKEIGTLPNLRNKGRAR